MYHTLMLPTPHRPRSMTSRRTPSGGRQPRQRLRGSATLLWGHCSCAYRHQRQTRRQRNGAPPPQRPRWPRSPQRRHRRLRARSRPLPTPRVRLRSWQPRRARRQRRSAGLRRARTTPRPPVLRTAQRCCCRCVCVAASRVGRGRFLRPLDTMHRFRLPPFTSSGSWVCRWRMGAGKLHPCRRR